MIEKVEDSAVKQEDTDFDTGNAGSVDEYDRKCDLERKGVLAGCL